MEIGLEREVYFDEYCPKCVRKNNEEDDKTCDECLEHCVMPYSHKPYNYEEA